MRFLGVNVPRIYAGRDSLTNETHAFWSVMTVDDLVATVVDDQLTAGLMKVGALPVQRRSVARWCDHIQQLNEFVKRMNAFILTVANLTGTQKVHVKLVPIPLSIAGKPALDRGEMSTLAACFRAECWRERELKMLAPDLASAPENLATRQALVESARSLAEGFNTLAGSMRLSNQAYAYRQLQLSSGPMRASGSVDIGPNGELSGRISAELGSRSVIVARGNLAVTGNLKTPVLK